MVTVDIGIQIKPLCSSSDNFSLLRLLSVAFPGYGRCPIITVKFTCSHVSLGSMSRLRVLVEDISKAHFKVALTSGCLLLKSKHVYVRLEWNRGNRCYYRDKRMTYATIFDLKLSEGCQMLTT